MSRIIQGEYEHDDYVVAEESDLNDVLNQFNNQRIYHGSASATMEADSVLVAGPEGTVEVTYFEQELHVENVTDSLPSVDYVFESADQVIEFIENHLEF